MLYTKECSVSPNIIVAGIGTDVGKTLVAAILCLLLDANYWKPIECGSSDTARVQQWGCRVLPPAYSLKAPLSPHHAARLEGIAIQPMTPPVSTRPLVIESAGGIFVPMTLDMLTLDLFQAWACQWVVVSCHYLGSINHTLLTLDALKQRGLPVRGIIFNGKPNPDSEKAICNMARVPVLGRLFPEEKLNRETFQKYIQEWQACF